MEAEGEGAAPTAAVAEGDDTAAPAAAPGPAPATDRAAGLAAAVFSIAGAALAFAALIA